VRLFGTSLGANRTQNNVPDSTVTLPRHRNAVKNEFDDFDDDDDDDDDDDAYVPDILH